MFWLPRSTSSRVNVWLGGSVRCKYEWEDRRESGAERWEGVKTLPYEDRAFRLQFSLALLTSC